VSSVNDECDDDEDVPNGSMLVFSGRATDFGCKENPCLDFLTMFLSFEYDKEIRLVFHCKSLASCWFQGRFDTYHSTVICTFQNAIGTFKREQDDAKVLLLLHLDCL
jgi:hypothetical protein